jgi:hypothetical protein
MTSTGFEFHWSPGGIADAEASDSPKPDFANLDGRHVYLRTVQPGDYVALQMMETQGEAAMRWRYRGHTPSPEQWLATLWNGVLAQFLVISKRTNEPQGLLYAYNTSQQDRHTYFAALKFNLQERSPLMILGTAIFVEYLFKCWDFKTLYMEVPAFNFEQFSSGLGKYFTIEGRLRDNYICAGRWWDLLILAIRRDDWDHRAQSMLSVAQPPKAPQVRLRMPPGLGSELA